MSMLCDDLPTYSKTGGGKKQMITLFLKPNSDKEYYRFRLLNFRHPDYERDYPFIGRWIHAHWGKTEKGVNIVDDQVVCMTTAFVPFNGPNSLQARREACPMCRHGEENFSVWKNSGWKDKIAMKKNIAMRRQFQGVVPVYVVHDPNNDKNNGKLKCFIINDPETYEKFRKLVHSYHDAYKSGKIKYDVFNGVNSVDFYLRMEKVPEVRNEGKPNETTIEVRKITKMCFGKNPYDIPSINEDLIKDFEFDKQYNVVNSPEEIERFYKKYFSVAMENIPKDEIDISDDDDISNEISSHESSGSGSEVLGGDDPVGSDVDVDMEDLIEDNPSEKATLLKDMDDIGSSPDVPEDQDEEISGDEVDSLISELDGLG